MHRANTEMKIIKNSNDKRPRLGHYIYYNPLYAIETKKTGAVWLVDFPQVNLRLIILIKSSFPSEDKAHTVTGIILFSEGTVTNPAF